MAQPSWVLLALIGAALVYEASARDCVKCSDTTAGCVEGTKAPEGCKEQNDVCYARIKDGVLHRGCTSDLSEDEQKSCSFEDGSSCKKCNNDGCNKEKWRKCASCTETATDHACAAGGAQLPKAYCKNFVKDDFCFQRFNAQALVERGCQSDVPAVEACANHKECKTCNNADSCNSDASTTFTTQCVQCDTTNDADKSCLKGTKAKTGCEKPSQGSCFSRITAAGVLQRGCKSSLSADEVTACKGETCNICNDDGCNANKFPANRAECYKCVASDTDKACDAPAGEANSEICSTYVPGDKCYSRSKDEVFSRGCQSDLGANEHPCKGSTTCRRCTGANCNKVTQEALAKEMSCQQCSASGDVDCAEGKAPSESCGGEKDTCITRIKDAALERKCLSQLDADDQAKCNEPNDASCVTCTGPGCNSLKVLSCHQCTEAADNKCAQDQSSAKPEPCKSLKADDKCFERLVNSKMERGCVSSLAAAAAEPCKGNEACRTCPEDGCNKADAKTLLNKDRCLQCVTSKDTNGKCLDGTEQSQPCATASAEKCYSRVLDKGDLQRGCHGDLPPEVANNCNTATCKICDKADCNSGVFPTNRLKCYQCKGDSDKSCVEALTGDGKSSYCKTYLAGDKCYSRIVNNVFERGCQSTLGKDDACKGLDEKHCASCDKANCNGISEDKLKNSALALKSMPAMLIAAIVVFVTKMF